VDESREESLEVGATKSLQRWEAKNETRHRCKVSSKPETILRFLFKSLTQVETVFLAYCEGIKTGHMVGLRMG
jgi:hypothetical protein